MGALVAAAQQAVFLAHQLLGLAAAAVVRELETILLMERVEQLLAAVAQEAIPVPLVLLEPLAQLIRAVEVEALAQVAHHLTQQEVVERVAAVLSSSRFLTHAQQPSQAV